MVAKSIIKSQILHCSCMCVHSARAVLEPIKSERFFSVVACERVAPSSSH